MKRLILVLGMLGLVGCDNGGLGTAPGVDAVAAPDAGELATTVDAGPCTLWDCYMTCYDAGCTCVYVCESHDPSVCPGPWPCK